MKLLTSRHHLLAPLTTHARTCLSMMMCAAMIQGCLREVPGSSCVQDDDCYLGEQCIVSVCAVSGGSVITQDMAMGDLQGDASPDLQDVPRDLGADMTPIQKDMPIMAAMFKEGIIIPNARLPGTRASHIKPGMSAPALLAYFEQENNGTLKLYYPDEASKTWRFTPIASQLDWDRDSLEHAAIFLEGSALYVFHEARNASASTRTLHRVSIASDWSVSSDEVVATLNNVVRLGFDYTEVGRPSALVTFPSGAQRYVRSPDGSWTLAHTHVEAFESARFVVDATHICGLVAPSSLKCYNEEDSKAELEEDKTTSFEVLSNDEHLVIARDATLRYAQIEDKKGGMGGLQWKGKVEDLKIPDGDRIAIARDTTVFTYRTSSGSVVWGRDVSMKDLETMSLQYNNPMTSPSVGEMKLHVVSSPDAGSPNQNISYQALTL